MFQTPLTLTVDNAAQVLETGLRAIAEGQMEFDLGAVASVDSAAVATLLAWQRAATAGGRRVTFHNLPPSLRGLVELYGVGDLIPAST